MRITRRDVAVALGAILATCAVGAVAQTAPAKLGPAVFDWAKMEARPTDVGAIRNLVRQPTATLDELEMHVTTLSPGLASHPPHTHPNEELVIVREGTVEVLNGGAWKRLGPGSVIFNASNSPHALRNVGDTPATYHVINWKTAARPAN
jgi:XRE family transcriptional regulator, regulator of sulfur utilization